MKIGLVLPHWSGAMAGHTPAPANIIDFAKSAQAIGIDGFWLTDHIYHEPYVDFLDHGYRLPDEYQGHRNGFWECWTMLAALAAETENVELGTLVTNTAFRNPALLANMAGTVDALSEGRLTLGVGAGDFRSEHQIHGFPWDRRVSRFEESLQILTPMLRGARVTFEGYYHSVCDAELDPPGARSNGLPLLIGSMRGGPRMRRLTIEYGDGWSGWLAFEDSHADNIADRIAALRTTCEQYDRDPDSLHGYVTVGITMPGAGGLVPGARPISGDPTHVAGELERFAELGIDHLAIYLHPCNDVGLEWLSTVLDRLS
jgi:alkanesulfonate monooxygenase SsuD/methylene tetrahydromethanopterin reductase-like flavin-dependent oxidoreductase (luciferase family)